MKATVWKRAGNRLKERARDEIKEDVEYNELIIAAMSPAIHSRVTQNAVFESPEVSRVFLIQELQRGHHLK